MLRVIVWVVIALIAFITLLCLKPTRKWPLSLIAIVAVVMLIVQGLWILDENKMSVNEKRKVWEIRREPLYYTYVTAGLDGELARGIAEFNEDLAKEKAKHESLWSNWFVGNYIDDIDYIHMPITSKGGA